MSQIDNIYENFGSYKINPRRLYARMSRRFTDFHFNKKHPISHWLRQY
jgi:hypothetical protein